MLALNISVTSYSSEATGDRKPIKARQKCENNMKQLFFTLARVVLTSKPPREGYTSFKDLGLKEPKPPKPSLKSETIIVEEISKKSVEKRRPAEIGIFCPGNVEDELKDAMNMPLGQDDLPHTYVSFGYLLGPPLEPEGTLDKKHPVRNENANLKVSKTSQTKKSLDKNDDETDVAFETPISPDL